MNWRDLKSSDFIWLDKLKEENSTTSHFSYVINERSLICQLGYITLTPDVLLPQYNVVSITFKGLWILWLYEKGLLKP